jgi:glycosyltransferase involved in cell wall biosynthesis
MALGVPVAATDCRSGPRELLAGGRFGPLVPVGDVAGLAAAIVEVLEHPLAADDLKAAVREYDAPTSAGRYLDVLGL